MEYSYLMIESYSKLFSCDKELKGNIKTIIRKYDRRILLTLASRLSNECGKVNSHLYKKYFPSIKSNKIKTVLISKQGLMYCMKWILAYGIEQDNVIEGNDNIYDYEELEHLIKIQLMLADYLNDDETDPKGFMFRNFNFNKTTNPAHEIKRAKSIFLDIAGKSNPSNSNGNYLNISQDFLLHHGYSLKHHIFYSEILLRMLYGKRKITSIYDRKFLLNYFGENPNVNKYLNSLTVSWHEAQNWAKRSIDNIWDYSLFLSKPLIEVVNSKLLSYSIEYLYNLQFEGVYHKIIELYSNSKKTRAYIGNLFEEYVWNISRDSITKTQTRKYSIINEFQIQGPLRSSDTYIKYKDSLIAVEVKGIRPRYVTKTVNKSIEFEKDIDKVLKAVKQAQTALDNIKTHKCKKLGKYKKVYIIVVSLDNILIDRFTWDYIKEQKFPEKLQDNVQGYINLSIHEYEYLCGLIHKKRKSFDVINEYFIDNYTKPFLNYIEEKNIPLNKIDIYIDEYSYNDSLLQDLDGDNH